MSAEQETPPFYQTDVSGSLYFSKYYFVMSSIIPPLLVFQKVCISGENEMLNRVQTFWSPTAKLNLRSPTQLYEFLNRKLFETPTTAKSVCDVMLERKM